MRPGKIFLCGIALFWAVAVGENVPVETRYLPELSEPVEIIKDPWGVSHIYARNQSDLFFAQGFNAASDRLFQLELWRRTATGTTAEILGSQGLQRDIGARLLRFRANLAREMRHYHRDGEEIINSFVQGYNAYVSMTEKDPSLLPVEFKLLGIKPGRWTPEVVVSRHNGLFRNAGGEIRMARLVNLMGEGRVNDLFPFCPPGPDLTPAAGLELPLMTEKVLETYQASRSKLVFEPDHLASLQFRNQRSRCRHVPSRGFSTEAGSNNWVISGRHTMTGKPFMANDPHRSLQVPSLRYWVHLVAPGWNVIGGGEPALPGVSIGHNEHGAWGLTIFPVDQEDLYVYNVSPEDPTSYMYGGKWEPMEVIHEQIPVKGRDPETVDLKYTRHGPVIFEDTENHKAYSLRAAWLEVGASPYLASLRIDQARNWEEFRAALSFFLTPSENLVWADREGNIGWQATGITPIRPNWSGLLPVPGDGRFEWEGFLPIRRLPHVLNPPEGFFATANQYNLPEDYPFNVGFLWTDPFRHSRIIEFLNMKRRFGLSDMIQLQLDLVSIPARSLIPLLSGLESDDSEIRGVIAQLLAWGCALDVDSGPAAIYVIWERKLKDRVLGLSVPQEAQEIMGSGSTLKLIEWLTSPDSRFGRNPMEGRDSVLIECLEEAIADVKERFGTDYSLWRLGHQKLHHAAIKHPLSSAVNWDLRYRLDVGPTPRGGNGTTVNMTSDSENQTSGATFRIIADLADWDRSLGCNAPGQSGDPDSKHYQDLLEPWSRGRYFPLYYSREKIESVAHSKTVLHPLSQ